MLILAIKKTIFFYKYSTPEKEGDLRKLTKK